MSLSNRGPPHSAKNYVEYCQPVSFAIKGLETALHITTFCI